MYSRDLSRAKDMLSELLLWPTEPVVFAALKIGLHGFETVVGVSVEERYLEGKPTGEMGLTVSLSKKIPESEIYRDFIIPKKTDGFDVQIEVLGEVFAQEFIGCYNPADGGSSIGHEQVTAGTLGCLVKNKEEKQFILSNNHILANCNNAHRGDYILQPGRIDYGIHDPSSHVNNDCSKKDKCIAVLEDFELLNFSGLNSVDAAIAAPLRDARPLSSEIKMVGFVGGHTDALPQMQVMKSGRTTEFTEGRIVSTEADVRVGYGVGVAQFKNQIKIKGKNDGVFSLGGDSGSLIVNTDKKAVGLLFAGSTDGKTTYANHINNVLNRFNVSIA